MSWFPVDDAFHSHPKARQAGDEAIGFWTRAGSYCMAYLTDGFVPEWWVKEQPKGATKARRLVAAGLWLHPAEKDGEQGFQFHDWKPECMKSHVLSAREKARQRKSKSRESQRESRVTPDVSPASCLDPTQPNPTQPNNPLVDLGGEVTQVDAQPLCCPKHPTGTDAPCRGCADARRAQESRSAAANAHELDRRRQLKSAVNACDLCDDNGMRELPNGLARCDHRAVVHA